MSAHATHEMHEHSLEAYGLHAEEFGEREQAILGILSAEGRPLTDRQLAARLAEDFALPMDMNTARPRISDLIRKGTLVETGSVRDADTGEEVRLVWFHPAAGSEAGTARQSRRTPMQELLDEWEDEWLAHPERWWLAAARQAVERRHFAIIGGRRDEVPYLVRCWLSKPRKARADSSSKWDSAESIMLHFFNRGDDDDALHDHPWRFSTTILAGGYYEHLPPPKWKPVTVEDPGPNWQRTIRRRSVGDTVAHAAGDLHCIGALVGPTWTLVHTGQAQREWGFWPQGREWIDYRTYLAERAEAEA